MVTLAGERQAPSSVPDDRRTDGHRLTEIDQPSPLLDVEFDKYSDTRQTLGAGPDVARIVPVRDGKFGVCDTVRVGERADTVRVDVTGEQLRTETSEPVAGTFFFREHGQHDGATRNKTTRSKKINGDQARR